jgi:hypothetical protein
VKFYAPYAASLRLALLFIRGFSCGGLPWLSEYAIATSDLLMFGSISLECVPNAPQFLLFGLLSVLAV